MTDEIARAGDPKHPTSHLDGIKSSFRFSRHTQDGVEFNQSLWENVSDIRKSFESSEVGKQVLPVYYPGSGSDVVFPIAMTNATQFIFVDYLYAAPENINPEPWIGKEIDEIGGKIVSESQEGVMGEGGKKTIVFEFNGKERTLILYAEDVTTFEPEELKDGASMIIIKAPTGTAREMGGEGPGYMLSPGNLERMFSKLAVGGFINRRPTLNIDSMEAGFRQVLEVGDPKKLYPLYQKQVEVNGLSSILTRDMDSYSE